MSDQFQTCTKEGAFDFLSGMTVTIVFWNPYTYRQKEAIDSPIVTLIVGLQKASNNQKILIKFEKNYTKFLTPTYLSIKFWSYDWSRIISFASTDNNAMSLTTRGNVLS